MPEAATASTAAQVVSSPRVAVLVARAPGTVAITAGIIICWLGVATTTVCVVVRLLTGSVWVYSPVPVRLGGLVVGILGVEVPRWRGVLLMGRVILLLVVRLRVWIILVAASPTTARYPSVSVITRTGPSHSSSAAPCPARRPAAKAPLEIGVVPAIPFATSAPASFQIYVLFQHVL